jgi:hypothetical protein
VSTCHDAAEIQRALEAIIEPGQVVELRALGVSTSRYPRPHTESGYFADNSTPHLQGSVNQGEHSDVEAGADRS